MPNSIKNANKLLKHYQTDSAKHWGKALYLVYGFINRLILLKLQKSPGINIDDVNSLLDQLRTYLQKKKSNWIDFCKAHKFFEPDQIERNSPMFDYPSETNPLLELWQTEATNYTFSLVMFPIYINASSLSDEASYAHALLFDANIEQGHINILRHCSFTHKIDSRFSTWPVNEIKKGETYVADGIKETIEIKALNLTENSSDNKSPADEFNAAGFLFELCRIPNLTRVVALGKTPDDFLDYFSQETFNRSLELFDEAINKTRKFILQTQCLEKLQVSNNAANQIKFDRYSIELKLIEKNNSNNTKILYTRKLTVDNITVADGSGFVLDEQALPTFINEAQRRHTTLFHCKLGLGRTGLGVILHLLSDPTQFNKVFESNEIQTMLQSLNELVIHSREGRYGLVLEPVQLVNAIQNGISYFELYPDLLTTSQTQYSPKVYPLDLSFFPPKSPPNLSEDLAQLKPMYTIQSTPQSWSDCTLL